MKFKLLAFILSITLSIGFIEVLLKISKQVPQIYSLSVERAESSYEVSENPLLGYELKKNYKVQKPDFHRSYPKTNNFGFRDKERKLEKSPNTSRVIFLGDSVTIGQGIKKISNTIPHRLEYLLNQGPSSSSFEVFNFGMSGYCTLGEIELLEKKGLKFKPDLVLLMFVDNDFISSNGAIVDSLRIERPKWQEDLFKKSNLFRLLSLSFNFFSFKDEFSKDNLVKKNAAAIGKDNVRRGLKRLKELSAKHNFNTLVAVWPSFNDKEILYSKQQLDENGNLKIKNILDNLEFDYIELKPAFDKNLSESSRKHKHKKISPNWSYTIGDGMHPNERGAKIAASYLAKKLGSQF